MIQTLTLKNFRNFSAKEFRFCAEKNTIIGSNGKGKTNILEALCLLSGNSISGADFQNHIQRNQNLFFISCTQQNGDIFSLSFDGETNKKNYFYNQKKVPKTKFNQLSTKVVIFCPIIMNLMYLGPSLRREFIDNGVKSSYPEYEKILKEYKTILAHRNKVLKNIQKQKSQKSEILFWDTKFIAKAIEVYQYRFKIIKHFESHISIGKQYFNDKITNIKFLYHTKVDKNNIQSSMESYLAENFERDIIIGSTHIGPHRDDFEILLDDKNIIDFASRGETKSMIVLLKLLEAQYIEEITRKKPILIIDDLMSELDEDHKAMIIENISSYQTFISGIENSIESEVLIRL